MKRLLKTLSVIVIVATVLVLIIAARGKNDPATAAAEPPRAHMSLETSSSGWPFPRSAEATSGALENLTRFTPRYPTTSELPFWAADITGPVDGVETPRKMVALTFDDGPSADTTLIVDELNTYNYRATFFWVGSRITTSAAEYAISNGEELANHTWDHPDMGSLTSEEASAEIGLTSARIAQFTGSAPTWFRSPFNRVFADEWDQISRHSLLYANYNVTSVDWMDNMQQSDVLLKISETLRPGGVILMHDAPGRGPKYLPAVLELLHSRGYTCVTMSDLMEMGPPVLEPLRLGRIGLGW